MTDRNAERLVSLLALAETALSTEEYLRYAARAEELRRRHPELKAISANDLRVQARINLYRKEDGGV